MENPIQETTDLFRFQITEEQEEERVDKCIAALIDSLSRSFIQKMIKEGRVCINGLPVKASYQVKAGDDLSFLLPKAQEPDIEPEDIPLDILYEDSDVLVVNKPKDMVVHPAAGCNIQCIALGCRAVQRLRRLRTNCASPATRFSSMSTVSAAGLPKSAIAEETKASRFSVTRRRSAFSCARRHASGRVRPDS